MMEDDLFYDYDSTSKSRFVLLPSFHLESPLREEGYYDVVFTLKEKSHVPSKKYKSWKEQTLNHIPIMNHTGVYFHEGLIDSNSMIKWIITLTNVFLNVKISQLDMSNKPNVEEVVKALWGHLINSNKAVNNLEQCNTDHMIVVKWWKTVALINDILLESTKINDNKNHYYLNLYPITGHQVKLFVYKNVIFIHTKKIHVITRDCLLLIGDLVQQRASLNLILKMGELNKFNWYPGCEVTNDIISLGDKILLKYPSLGYSLLKFHEGLCLGLLMDCEVDKYTDSKQFLAFNLSEMNTVIDTKFIEEKDKIWALEWKSNLIDKLRKLQENVHWISQIFGLYRIWGHPIINPVKGCLSLQRLCKIVKVLDMSIIKQGSRKLKEMICINYKVKEGKWPNLNLTKLSKHSYLYQVLEHNLPLDTKSPLYDKEEWDLIKGMQTFEIEETYNVVNLISDKALSLNKTELIQQLSQHKAIGLPSERRVIIQWMKTNFPSAKEFLSKIDNNDIPDDWKVIGVCPKEREMKETPRMFSLMTLGIRMYFVLTEHLLAEHIIPLLPQITMIDDELSLLKKTYAATRDQGLSKLDNQVKIVINMDFEKWNSNMRHELVQPMLEFIDELLGYKSLISSTHEIITDCTIYLADGSTCPNVDQGHLVENEICWRDHLGGIEGIRQKGWSIITVAFIALASQDLPIQVTTTAQGDNVVCTVLIHKPSTLIDSEFTNYVKDNITLFKYNLNYIFSKIGLPIKLEETWCSSHLFAYGKRLFFNGNQLSMSLKRLIRTFPINNEGVPSLSSSVSTIFANCFTACMFDYKIWLIYWFATLTSALSIIIHVEKTPVISITQRNNVYLTPEWKLPRYLLKTWRTVHKGKYDNNEDSNIPSSAFRDRYVNTILWLLILPGELGGLPIMNLSMFYLRGFPDQLTSAISFLLEYIKYCDKNTKIRIMHWIFGVKRIENHNTDIIESPFSINIKRPATPDTFIRYKCEEYLKSLNWIKNKFAKNFINTSLDDPETYKIELLKMKPLHPRLMSEMFSATLWGYFKSLMGRILDTKTIQSLAIKGQDQRFMSTLVYNELNYRTGTLSILFNKELDNSSVIYLYWRDCQMDKKVMCSREISQILREYTWKIQDIVGVTVPFPSEMFQEFPLIGESCAFTNCHSDDIGYILFKNSYTPSIRSDHILKQLGPGTPYMGSFTSEKITNHEDKVSINKESLIKRAYRLLRAINWLSSEYEILGQEIIRIFSSLTDLEPFDLIPQSFNISGSDDHRFKDQRTDHGGFISTMYNLGTWVSFSTDTLKKYVKGGKNYNIHFQSVMCYFQCVITQRLLHNDTNTWHLHEKCSNCIIQVNETSPKLKRQIKAQLPSLPGNPYCWIPAEKLVKQEIESEVELKRLSVTEEINDSDVYRLCSILITEQIVNLQILSEGLSGSSVTFKRDIPIIWFAYLNPHKLLKYVMYNILNYNIFSSRNWFSSLLERQASLKSGVNAMKPSSLYPLVNMFHFEESRLEIVRAFPMISLPNSIPYTITSCQNALKDLLIFLAENFEEEDYMDFLKTAYVIPSVNRSLTTSVSTIYSCMLDCLDKSNDKLSISEQRYITSKLKNIEKLIAKKWFNLFNNPLELSKTLSLLVRKKEFIDLEFWESASIVLGMKDTVLNVSADYAIKQLKPMVAQPLKEYQPDVDLNKIKFYGNVYNFKHLEVHTMTSLKILYKTSELDPPNPRGSIGHYKRPLSLITTSFYKNLEVFSLERQLIQTFSIGIMLGDGTGGISTCLLKMNKHSRLFFNTYIDLRNILPNSLGNLYPPALEMTSIDKERLIAFPSSLEGITDITDDRFPAFVSTCVNKSDIICCDAEGSGWENGEKGIKLMLSILKISIMTNCPLCIVKTYASNVSMLQGQLSLMFIVYSEVKLVKSSFSGDFSTEIYIIGKNIRHLTLSSFEKQIIPLKSGIVINTMYNVSGLSLFLQNIKDILMNQKIDLTKKNVLMFNKQLDNMIPIQKLKDPLVNMSFGIMSFSTLTAHLREIYNPLFINVNFSRKSWKINFFSYSDLWKILGTIMLYTEFSVWGSDNMETFYDKIVNNTRFMICKTKKSWAAFLIMGESKDIRKLDERSNILKLIDETNPRVVKKFMQYLGRISTTFIGHEETWFLLYTKEDYHFIDGTVEVSSDNTPILKPDIEVLRDSQFYVFKNFFSQPYPLTKLICDRLENNTNRVLYLNANYVKDKIITFKKMYGARLYYVGSGN